MALPPSRIPRTLATVVAATAVAVWGTWPLASGLSTRLFYPSNGPFPVGARSDVLLTVWILAWGTHALTTRPLSLFDANVFHPAPASLAFSEHMLGAQPVYLPLALASGDAVFAHQTTLVLTFVLAFLAGFALVWTWTRDAGAAFVAGSLFAFSPFRIANLSGTHIEGCFYLPLVPLVARRVVERRRADAVVALSAILVAQALWSYYLGYVTFVTTGVLCAVVAAGRRPGTVRLVLATGAAAVAVAASALPYLAAKQGGVITAPTEKLMAFGVATPGATGAGPALVLALATVPFWRRSGVPLVWLGGLVAVLVVSHVLALGPTIHVLGVEVPGPFAILQLTVPGFSAIRVPARFNAGATMAAAALAGIGMAGVARSVVAPGRRIVAHAAAVALGVGVVALATGEKIVTQPVPVAPTGAYEWLARRPPEPLLEIPFRDAELETFQRETEVRRMFFGIGHWGPLLNGYSGYVPPSYRPVAALVRALPDPTALAMLVRATGVRRVLVHRAELSRAERRRWRRRAARSGLVPVAVLGRDVVFETPRDLGGDLVPRIVVPSDGVTALGTSRADVPPPDRRVRLAFVGRPPATSIRGLALPVRVRVENPGGTTWPALATGGRGLVGLVHRWHDRDGRVVGQSHGAQQLPYDLPPGAAVETSLLALPPPVDPARLEIGVAQDEQWFEGTIDAGWVGVVR